MESTNDNADPQRPLTPNSSQTSPKEMQLYDDHLDARNFRNCGAHTQRAALVARGPSLPMTSFVASRRCARERQRPRRRLRTAAANPQGAASFLQVHLTYVGLKLEACFHKVSHGSYGRSTGLEAFYGRSNELETFANCSESMLQNDVLALVKLAGQVRYGWLRHCRSTGYKPSLQGFLSHGPIRGCTGAEFALVSDVCIVSKIRISSCGLFMANY